MNRQLLILIACASALLLVGILVFTLAQRSSVPVETSRVESVPTKKPAPVAKSAAEVLLERPPEQPVLSGPRGRAAKSAPAASAESAPSALTTGTLRIESDVAGVQVFIDREFVGTAPVTADGIKPGTHRLNVAAEGYDGIVETIEVTPGERTVTVRFREVRLDAAIDVVHKHRMGSCKGRLIATSQGIRYETSDKDDSFSVALTDLEVFQVDYLEKNLKVKPKKGKQYNFTEPQGNADKLFVFHRDVDKARERLKKGDAPAR